MDINNPIQKAIIFYLIIMIAIVYIKPKLLYDENNNIKQFGFGSNQTIFSLYMVGIILPIILYAMFALANCVYCNE